MTAEPERVALHAFLTPEGHGGWQRLAEEQGVSLSALVDVIGRDLATIEDSDTYRRDLITAARRLDAARRRRGRR